MDRRSDVDTVQKFARLGSWHFRTLVALFVVVAIVFSWQQWKLTDESHTRREQFCHLVNASHREHVKQYRQTGEFLKSKDAKRTGLVPFIRAGLPAQRHEIKVERKAIPDVCLDVEPKPEPV